MIFAVFRGRSARASVERLYGAAMAAAREEALYADLGVADSFEGRFEMLVLTVGLLTRRLAGDEETREVSRALMEHFFADMDRTLRQIGVGDLSVPKRIKSMSEAFFGRLAVYGEALDAGDRDRLAAALRRNVYAGGGADAAVGRLADHVLAMEAALAARPAADVAAGAIGLPSISPAEGRTP